VQVLTSVPIVPVTLSTVVAHELVLSVALERVVEILKGVLPFWPFAGSRSPSSTAYRLRSAAMIVITTAIATGFCWKFRMNVLHIQHVRSGYIAAGLAGAFGAAFWNNLLGLMRAARYEKEASAGN
jgi:hypothetical protein